MKLRSYAPAMIAVVVLGVVYVVVSGRDEPAPPRAAREAPVAQTPVRPPQPPASMPADEHAHAPDEPAHAGPAPTTARPPLDEYAVVTEGPAPVAKKPKLTLDEKLAETQKHIGVMEKRAGLLELEIAALERDGKTKEAAEQRIVLQRLRAHADKLRTAIAERRDPE